MSDARAETYDFSMALPAHAVEINAGGKTSGNPDPLPAAKKSASDDPPPAAEHLVVVRVWDRFGNLATEKVITR